MKPVFAKALLGAAFTFASLTMTALPGAAADKAAADKFTAEAKAAAGSDMQYLTKLCTKDGQGDAMRAYPQPVTPFKIFDNMWFIGSNFVGTLVITTSKGIILIDTMDNPQEADDFILAGLKKAGLNPQDVKYIIATHGHADHYGGMQELKDKIPGVRLMMGPADWDYAVMRASDPKTVKPPAKDLSAKDGMKLTLGDETITIYVTPGHTPGSLAFLIPVKDHGTPHMISEWGGTTMYSEPHSLAEFRISLDRFAPIEKAAHAEGRVSTHPVWTNMLTKMDQMRAHPDAPNPFLEGQAQMDRYVKVRDLCYQAIRAMVP